MLKEFKEFALKGNVMDLAIGVIIGGAFGAIVYYYPTEAACGSEGQSVLTWQSGESIASQRDHLTPIRIIGSRTQTQKAQCG